MARCNEETDFWGRRYHHGPTHGLLTWLGWKFLVIEDARGACADQVIAAGFDAGSKLCIRRGALSGFLGEKALERADWILLFLRMCQFERWPNWKRGGRGNEQTNIEERRGNPHRRPLVVSSLGSDDDHASLSPHPPHVEILPRASISSCHTWLHTQQAFEDFPLLYRKNRSVSSVTPNCHPRVIAKLSRFMLSSWSKWRVPMLTRIDTTR